jgi:hypothetical protein
MPARTPHYVSLSVAILVGFWSAVSSPATHQFELLMRALGWTGPVLAPLGMLYGVAVTLIAMAVVYSVSMTVFERLGIPLRDEWDNF